MISRSQFASLALGSLLGAALTSSAAHSQTIAWTDWTAATAGLPGSAVGNITSTAPVSISYNGEIAFAQISGGTDYWIPSTPYLSPTVTDAPTNNDIIALRGGNDGVDTLTFSRPVTNPVIAIVSLGQAGVPISYNFNAPFTVLSSGVGYFGGGEFTNTSGNTLQGEEDTESSSFREH